MKREEIDKKYQWSIDEMVQDKSFEEQLEEIKKLSKEILSYKGKLQDDSELLKLLKTKTKASRIFSNISAYSKMKLDEDTTYPSSQTRMQQVSQIYTQFLESISFIDPELLKSDIKRLERLQNDADFSDYSQYLLKLVRESKHILSEKEEAILASFNDVIFGSSDIYDMLTDADLEFGEIKVDGENKKLTNGNYITFLTHSDQNVRKEAFERMHGVYGKHENSIFAMYSNAIKAEITEAKVRKYNSSLEMSLYSDNIPTEVYNNLIKTVKSRTDLLERWAKLKQKSWNIESFHIYDSYLPFVKDNVKEIAFEDGFKQIIEALKPLGDEYITILSKSIEERWMDIFENDGKASGAYSYGSYDSKPYVLLNYQGDYRDVSTVAHELGHSLHSYFSRLNQPYPKAGYSLFTAEVASTLNEALLIRHQLEFAENPEEKRYLIGSFLDELKGTLFRQVMFAEFEQIMHSRFEEEKPLNVEETCKLYLDLNKEYFRNGLIIDESIKYEWFRIGHFYRPFYVYMYATSVCASLAISEKILEGDEKAKKNYLDFLKLGGSMFPIDELKTVGVDMTKSGPIEKGLKMFENLLDEYEKLLK